MEFPKFFGSYRLHPLEYALKLGLHREDFGPKNLGRQLLQQVVVQTQYVQPRTLPHIARPGSGPVHVPGWQFQPIDGIFGQIQHAQRGELGEEEMGDGAQIVVG